MKFVGSVYTSKVSPKCGEAGTEFLKPVPNDYLQRCPLSKRVDSSEADADDPTLIERVELEAA